MDNRGAHSTYDLDAHEDAPLELDEREPLTGSHLRSAALFDHHDTVSPLHINETVVPTAAFVANW